MGQVFYPQFADTVPSQPGDLPSAYIPHECPQPKRIPRRREIDPFGAAFLLICAAGMVLSAYGISLLARWVFAL